jgi:hypothetical protein
MLAAKASGEDQVMVVERSLGWDPSKALIAKTEVGLPTRATMM